MGSIQLQELGSLPGSSPQSSLKQGERKDPAGLPGTGHPSAVWGLSFHPGSMAQKGPGRDLR